MSLASRLGSMLPFAHCQWLGAASGDQGSADRAGFLRLVTTSESDRQASRFRGQGLLAGPRPALWPACGRTGVEVTQRDGGQSQEKFKYSDAWTEEYDASIRRYVRPTLVFLPTMFLALVIPNEVLKSCVESVRSSRL